MDKKAFGETLFKLRMTKGASQAEAAEHIGLTVSAYQNYETGRREAGYETICKLADFYGTTTDYLLGRPEAKPPDDPVKKLVEEKNLSTLEEILIEKYLKLSDAQREQVLQFLRDSIEEEKRRQQTIHKFVKGEVVKEAARNATDKSAPVVRETVLDFDLESLPEYTPDDFN